jgi:hypothetical protein
MAKKKKARAEIRKNTRTGHFLLMHYAARPSVGWTVAWGEPSRFSPDDFRRLGLAAVLKSLREFFSRDGEDHTKAFRVPEDQQKDFTRLHQSLGVRQDTPTRLVFTPTRHQDGGYVGEDHIEMSLPSSPAEFFARVEEAFKHCS